MALAFNNALVKSSSIVATPGFLKYEKLVSVCFLNGLKITHGYAILPVPMAPFVSLVFCLVIGFQKKMEKLKNYTQNPCLTGVMQHVASSGIQG